MGAGGVIPSFMMKKTKYRIQEKPQTTLYRKHNRLSIASSSNDMDPINTKIRPTTSELIATTKLSKNFATSADESSPNASSSKISLKCVWNKRVKEVAEEKKDQLH